MKYATGSAILLYKSNNMKKGWDAQRVRELRRRLGLSQEAMARELGVRQQTISDWETGAYTPRGASSRVLSMVAEQAASYITGPPRRAAQDERTGGSGRRGTARQRTANSPERRSRLDGQKREGGR